MKDKRERERKIKRGGERDGWRKERWREGGKRGREGKGEGGRKGREVREEGGMQGRWRKTNRSSQTARVIC